jgi:thiol:disulfide interchange protein DsbC
LTADSYAAAQPTTDEQRLRTVLAERFPQTEVLQLQPSSDLPGFHEVVTPSEVVYLDATGTRLVIGQVMELATGLNLTQRAWDAANPVDFGALPFEHAVRLIQGAGRRRLAVFTDPFCMACAHLQKMLAGLDDVTIDVFLHPLESQHPGAMAAAIEIWCAPDRAAAWTGWMLHAKAPQPQTCEGSPVEEVLALGERLRVHSLPTMVFADGSRWSGMADAAAIEAQLRRSTVAGAGGVNVK